MKILLTGGGGFLGSSLAKHLNKMGHPVALLTRPGSRLDRLPSAESLFDIGCCSSSAEIDTFLQHVRPEVVVHTACGYGRQGESIFDLVDTNVGYGLTMIGSLLRMDHPITFINTGTVLDPQVSPYALTKHQFSDLGRLIATQSAGKLRFINILLQHMYGAGDSPSKFISSVIKSCFQNTPELKLTLGQQQRDLIYIDDVVSAITILIAQREQFALVADVELGSGVAPTIRELVESVHRLTSSHTNLLFGALPYRTNEVMFSQANISKLQALGWSPKFDLEAGLKRTIEMELSK